MLAAFIHLSYEANESVVVFLGNRLSGAQLRGQERSPFLKLGPKLSAFLAPALER